MHPEEVEPLIYRFKRCAQPAVDGDILYDQEWECDQRGKAAPFSFTVAAYEDDGDAFLSGFCRENLVGADWRGPDILPPLQFFCVEGRGELIGKKKVELKLEDLSELRSPGQSFLRSIELYGGCDNTELSAVAVAPIMKLVTRLSAFPMLRGSRRSILILERSANRRSARPGNGYSETEFITQSLAKLSPLHS